MSVSCRPVTALHASTNFLLIRPTPVLPYVSPVSLSQLYMYQQIFYSSGQPQFCHICYLSACPSFTCINKFSTHQADPSSAMSVSCWPVPPSQASTHFPIIWPAPVLPCMLPVGLSHFTCINNISNHPADPSFAMCFICQPVPILQASTNFPVGQPTPVLQYYWSSACPSFTGLIQFSHPPADPSLAMLLPVGQSQFCIKLLIRKYH